MKKVLFLNGSPHKTGNTSNAMKFIEEELLNAGISVEWFQLGTAPVRGCIGCNKCQGADGQPGLKRCVFDDDANLLIEKILESDGIIVGSPVYFGAPNGSLCALLDRVFYASCNDYSIFKGKYAAGVVTCWRAGSTAAIDRLNKYFTFSQMPVVSSCYWNMSFESMDDWGEETLRTLGKNMAELINGRKE